MFPAYQSTFVCPTELIAFSDASNEFKELNTQVIGISVDSQFVHMAWINTPRNQGGLGNMEIPLVADQTRRIARDYGVLLEDDGFALRFVYCAVLQCYCSFFFFFFFGIANRGLFIIDPKGGTFWSFVPSIFDRSFFSLLPLPLHTVLRQITVNDLPVGRSVEETIRLIQAFQVLICFLGGN